MVVLTSTVCLSLMCTCVILHYELPSQRFESFELSSSSLSACVMLYHHTLIQVYLYHLQFHVQSPIRGICSNFGALCEEYNMMLSAI